MDRLTFVADCFHAREGDSRARDWQTSAGIAQQGTGANVRVQDGCCLGSVAIVPLHCKCALGLDEYTTTVLRTRDWARLRMLFVS